MTTTKTSTAHAIRTKTNKLGNKIRHHYTRGPRKFTRGRRQKVYTTSSRKFLILCTGHRYGNFTCPQWDNILNNQLCGSGCSVLRLMGPLAILSPSFSVPLPLPVALLLLCQLDLWRSKNYFLSFSIPLPLPALLFRSRQCYTRHHPSPFEYSRIVRFGQSV